jgi:hypothetical protein
MAKINETKKTFGTHFAIEHGCDFARTVFGIASERVARGDRLRQPQINFFKKSRRSFSIAIKLHFSIHA